MAVGSASASLVLIAGCWWLVSNSGFHLVLNTLVDCFIRSVGLSLGYQHKWWGSVLVAPACC
jgi:hypothetical protein